MRLIQNGRIPEAVESKLVIEISIFNVLVAEVYKLDKNRLFIYFNNFCLSPRTTDIRMRLVVSFHFVQVSERKIHARLSAVVANYNLKLYTVNKLSIGIDDIMKPI